MGGEGGGVVESPVMYGVAGAVGMVLCCMDDDDTILPCAGKTL